MEKKSKSYEMDMCSGPIFVKLMVFAIPLALSSMLQLLFNAADVVVVGRFAGSESLAAVGATSALISLLVNVFIGLSVGANVLAAQYFGAQKQKDLEETIHTSMVMAGVGGIVLLGAGVILAKPLLELMGTPDDVLPLAVLYMKIFFLGMPVNLIYNFGSALLRAVGDTKRPLYFLLFSGVINVLLNLFFVIALSMGVAGVALATVISQCVSAYMIIRCLMKADAAYSLDLKKLGIAGDKMRGIVRIGFPAGLQGAIFQVSNVLFQSSINSFGAVAIAGNTASQNIESIVYTAMGAINQTALSFISQNFGAKQYLRMKKVMIYCLVLTTVVGGILGNGAVFLGRGLLGIYSSDPQVIRYGMLRLGFMGTAFFFCGLMDCVAGGLRGMGYSVMPMIVSLTGACGFRVAWLYTAFAANRTLETLYFSYPLSWAITFGVHLVCYLAVSRKVKQRFRDAVG